ncbi:MAG: ergothioneine biosynthesis protein EgtB [Bacteroidia bacterium]
MHLAPPDTTQRLAAFQRVRQQSLALTASLRPEDTVVQPVVDVSPPKWHLGHTTWFFEEFLLKPYLADYQVFHPRYAYLFNSYYEGAGERVKRAYRGNMTRPGVEEICAYRAHVDLHMERLLADPRFDQDSRLRYILDIGLNHEQQHQELLLYDIKYILGHNPLFPAYREDPAPQIDYQPDLAERWLDVDAGVYTIGYDGPDFHFDNEEGVHRVFLEGYRIMDRLVTAGEFLAFVEAGGYRDYRYWLEEGWRWVGERQIEAPFYWFRVEDTWQQVTLHGLELVDLRAPMAHVSFYEADAYARWRGLRLPTEQEWEVACRRFAPVVPPQANFVESMHFRPLPRRAGDLQLYGDLWEWTNSAYLPYPYYHAEESTLGEYNGKFMINQMVLRGGSYATPRDHIRPSYRNFFHPHLQWLFNGFRLAAYT